MFVVINMRKNKQKNYKITTTTELDYVRVVKITLGVLLVFIVVYLVAAIASGEIKLGNKKKDTTPEATIQYQEIIGGSMLNRVDKEYYVLLFDFSDEYSTYYQTLVKSYTSKDKSLPVYFVDLGKKINEDYKVPEEQKGKVIEYTDLRVEEVALVKVKDGKINGTYDGKDKVIDFFTK